MQLISFIFFQEFVLIIEMMIIFFDYYCFIIGVKGVNVCQMMEEFDVNIIIFFSRDEFDQVVIVGI